MNSAAERDSMATVIAQCVTTDTIMPGAPEIPRTAAVVDMALLVVVVPVVVLVVVVLAVVLVVVLVVVRLVVVLLVAVLRAIDIKTLAKAVTDNGTPTSPTRATRPTLTTKTSPMSTPSSPKMTRIFPRDLRRASYA